MTGLPPTIHGTCVQWRGSGILIVGVSGSGKSQLALTLMAEEHKPAHLVADDRVVITCRDQSISASAPPALSGKIERYGMGIETHIPMAATDLDLVVELVLRDQIERLPEPEALIWSCGNLTLPKLILPAQPINPVSAIYTTLRGAGR